MIISVTIPCWMVIRFIMAPMTMHREFQPFYRLCVPPGYRQATRTYCYFCLLGRRGKRIVRFKIFCTDLSANQASEGILKFRHDRKNNDESRPWHVVYFFTKGTPAFGEWLKEDIEHYNLNLQPDYRAWDNPVGGSDNGTFAKLGIPIMWYHTDWHPDYHLPGDEADKINWDKLVEITKTSFLGLWKMANISF